MAAGKEKKLKAILLVLAAALFAAAAFLYFTADDGALKAVCEEVNAYGYAFSPGDWYAAGGQDATSIAALSDEDLAEAVAASRRAGFPSEVDRLGEVVLLLAQTENDDVVTVYIVNGELELCFVQTLDGTIKALGE